MQEFNNSISIDYQDKLNQQFYYIQELIDNEQINQALEALLNLHPADIADFLDNTHHRNYPLILSQIEDKIDPEVLMWLSDGNKQSAIEALGIRASAKLIAKLDLEDAIDVIEALDFELKELIISKLDNIKKQQIIEGFKYPENSAGRLLEKNYIALKQNWTVNQAIEYIKKNKFDSDFPACILVDSRSRPTGTILASSLIKADNNDTLEKLKQTEFMIADTAAEVEEIIFLFKQYSLTIIPIINKQGKLIGSISIDNIIYLMEEHTQSEYLHLGGIHNNDIFSNLLSTVTSRFPWLFVNLVTACITSLVINEFSEAIEKLVALATIMPIVASMGGNAGTQVLTVTVKALANREINPASNYRVINKEICVCAINGLALAAIGTAIIYILFKDPDLSIIFAVSVLLNFVIAGFLGSFIPIILNKFDIDPAAASGVFLTACTDAIGFFSFLGLAYFYLI